jgi:hypothetical protein
MAIGQKTSLTNLLRAGGPYALIGLFVPGGSLIALVWWAFRNRSWLAARLGRASAIAAPFFGVALPAAAGGTADSLPAPPVPRIESRTAARNRLA